MKNTRALVMLIIAAITGLVAVVLASSWINQQAQAGASKIAVVVTDVDLGARISSEMVKLVDWPASSIPSGAFAEAKALDGRVAKTSMQRGEPVLESKLAPIGTKGGLSAVLSEGKRAMTVKVNEVVGVAGFALPGNYVDIMVNTQEERARENDQDRTISKIVLQQILVLAVAQEANRDETKPKVVNAVTLEVTPEQAEILDLARSVGVLSLVLRNQIEPKAALTEGATKATLLGGVAPAPVEPAKPAPVQVVQAKPKQVVKRTAKPAASAASQGKDCVELIRGVTKVTECF